jgi:hypothetical protein
MVEEDKLSSVVSEFARTMVTDFLIEGSLNCWSNESSQLSRSRRRV